MDKIKGGLQPTVADERDFQLGKIVTLPKLDELPDEMIFRVRWPKHQGETDFCTSYATCLASELQEGVELAPEFSFGASKAISGDPEKWGQDIRSAMKSHVEYGALEVNESNKSILNTDLDKLRHFDIWTPVEKSLAKKHRKKSYFKVTGKYDSFDNIRASLYKFRAKQQSVTLGVTFGWPLTEYFFEDIKTQGVGHCMEVIGMKKFDGVPYLVVHNSYEGAGDGGVHYVSREVINYNVERFGAYMMVDLSREEAEDMLERNLKLDDNWFLDLIKRIMSLLWKK